MQFSPERPEVKHESMCLQGSCFVLRKDLYFDLDLDEEGFGSWGSQGVEIGCKAWLSGNRVLTTKNTFYGHLFRIKDEDFPYDRGPDAGKQSNDYAKELFLGNKWSKAKYPLEWLVEKFNRPADW